MLEPLGPDGMGPGARGPPDGPSAATSPSGAGRWAAAEVDTEFDEDEGHEEEGSAAQEQGQADEVEEELEESSLGEAGGAAGAGRGGPPGEGRSGDYAVPAANREVWRNFGCNTEAGRALRRLYAGATPTEAAAMVSYPRASSPANRWEPKAAARKPCPQRAAVKVPRARREGPDPDDPRHWRAPLPGRRPAKEIIAEMEAERPVVPDLPRGRDQAAEKNHLQDRFQFCGGRAMPKGAMGHVEQGDMPEAAPSIRAMLEERERMDDNGMTAEHREIFQELMLSVKRKQARLAEIDAEEAAEARPGKARTARNKEALELRNDIDRCMKDIGKLIELTEQ